MLEVGKKAPDFELPDQNGDRFRLTTQAAHVPNVRAWE